MTHDLPPVLSGFRQLAWYLGPYAGILLLAGLLMTAESLVSLATPWLAGRFAEILLEGGEAAGFTLTGLFGAWVLLFCAQALSRFFSTYLVNRSGAELLTTLSRRLYDHLQALPLGELQSRKRGDLLSLFSNDITTISHFLTGTLAGLLPTLVVFAGAFFMMFTIDPQVAWLVTGLVPLFFITLKLLGRRIRPVSSSLMQRQADALALVEENLGLLPLIKAHVRETLEARRFRHSTGKVLRLRKRQLRLQAMLSPVLQLLASLGILLVLWTSSERLLAGQLTLPELVSLLLYGLLFARPVSSLANLYGQLQQVRGASARLLRFFAIAPEPPDLGHGVLPPVEGRIDIHDLHYHHPGGRELYGGLDVHIEPGETVALNGPNGAGKSTLLHLLMRFADPQQGRIEIDGIDIRSVTLASLRSQIGLVSQQVLLADASVADNIRYGHLGAGDEEVQAAARAAHAHEFIRSLPEGYDTLIGENGVRLSGGQRQRIALARALIGDPPILLLDEATAMLDAEGERHFITECGDLLESRTVILITHRPESLALVDRVIELKVVPSSADEERARYR